MLDRRQTVADLVLDHAECAEILERHHIDFCCQGGVSLEVAAAARGLDLEALLQELSHAIAERRGRPTEDPRELSTSGLIEHIVTTHHLYLRRMLPFLRELASKVSRVHGAHNAKLRTLHTAVTELAEVVLPHLDEEEQSLFPTLTAPLVEAREAIEQLDSMREEHHAVAGLLERVRAASDDFSLPEWACSSYRTLFAELERLERNVHTHVHLENHVLAPRFMPLEAGARA